MFRLEGSVVKRYSEALDAFLKIRKFSPEEINRLLLGTEIENRMQYQQLIMHTCVVGYAEDLLPQLQEKPLDTKEIIETGLYQLVIDVNPKLDIQHVSIPVLEEEGSAPEIHLLEQTTSAGVLDKDKTWVLSLEDQLNSRVIGQRDAAYRLARGIKKAVAGIRDTQKPVGSFMFVGNTGVGKTEMAKALADEMFGEEQKLIRIDCSEYALPHEYAKLIGAPPGYIGYHEGGHLTEKLKSHGGQVILFDEIEKADRKVHNLLLQILDEGFLTDSSGQRVTCSEAVIILTSNAAIDKLSRHRNSLGFRRASHHVDDEKYDRIAHEALKEYFRPEFLNRIDEILTFRNLEVTDCQAIIRLMLATVAGYARKTRLHVTFDDAVMHILAAEGYSEEYGARELRRTVKRRIEGPLSDLIITGQVQANDHIQVCLADNGKILFNI
ncbi:AAA family ATPase [Planctomycetota bacterium]